MKQLESVPNRRQTADMIFTVVRAIQDYEYMVQFVGTGDDPFVASSERRVDHKILVEEMNEAGIDFARLAGPDISRQDVKLVVLPTGPWSADDTPIWGYRYLSNAKGGWIRARE